MNEKLLTQSIKQLEANNKSIIERIKNITNKDKIEELNKTLAKNNSMILDYQYQIKKNLNE